MSLLFRLVVREMLGPLLFGLGAFTILFFAVETLGGVARLVLESKLGVATILEYMLNRLPQVLIFTCPMAVLLAGLTAFGRLSGDSELTALKAAGVSFLRIATPAMLLCAAISAASVWMNDEVVPRSLKRAFDILYDTKQRDPFQAAFLTAPRQLKNGESQMLYANGFDIPSRTLHGVYLHYFWTTLRRREVFAEEARWNGEVWVLRNMRVTVFDEKQEPIQEMVAGETWTPLQPGDSPADPDTLLAREYQPLELSRQELAQRLAVMPAGQEGSSQRRRRNQYEVMFHQKLALPFTSLVFGAFSVPLGVRPQRSSRSIGIGLSLLFILIYYILMTIGSVLGEAGSISPWLAAWLPNLLFGAMGLILLLDATRK